MSHAALDPAGGRIDAVLAAFRADVPLKAPGARSLAASIENPRCTARRVLDAAGVDKAALVGHDPDHPRLIVEAARLACMRRDDVFLLADMLQAGQRVRALSTTLREEDPDCCRTYYFVATSA